MDSRAQLLQCDISEALGKTCSSLKPAKNSFHNRHEHHTNIHRQSKLVYALMLTVSLLLLYSATTTKADIVIISPNNRTTEIFDNAELNFGSVPLEGISGNIIMSEPDDACSEVKKPPTTQDSWFLLAKRHTCSFVNKVRNAADAGYKAIIIYNVDPNKKTAHHIGQKVQYTTYIPALLISYIDGVDIRQNYLYDKGFTALILPRVPFPFSAYLLPFAIVIIVCLFLMVSFLVFQIIKCARDRRKLLRHRLTSKQLKQLLTTVYTKGSQYDTCAVCLDEYMEGEKLRILPCGHGYHSRCIDPWLTKSRRICPVCKGKVRVAGDFSDTESESENSRPSNMNRNTNESTPLLINHQQNASRTTSEHGESLPAIAGASNAGTQPTINGSINGAFGDHGSLSSSTPGSRRYCL